MTRGKSVAVIGCGGVGAAAVAGSRLAGAGTIIAVDIDDRKLRTARSMGATHTVNSTETDPDHGVTSGTFSLDGETFEVDDNVWVVGDDTECVVIDAPHDVEAIVAVVGDRRVKAILLTHAHDDHVRAAPALRERTQAPLFLHPGERPLWDLTHGGDRAQLWDVDLADGATIEVAGTTLRAIHTPGHAPGAVCFHAPDLGCLFSGDTLFNGGPGATGRCYSDRPALMASIRDRLLTLPDDTEVHTGHGDDTTIGAERAGVLAEG